MNKKTMIFAVAAACLAVSASAFAQNHGNGHDRGRSEQARDNNHDRGRGEQARGNNRPDHNNYRDHGRNDRENYGVRDHGHRSGLRGAGPRHDMHRGGRIAREYRGNQYVVNDWRGHHLSAPPRGSHWVQAGNDYVLVAVVSGIIAQVLLAN